jgi:DNA-binding XRE family transcriptional regulator
MNAYKVSDHLKEKTKDPHFKELYELEAQKYSIVEKIVKYRIDKKMTQEQLAEQVGVTQQQISKVENGEFSNVMTLEKILLAIGKIKAIPFKRVSNSN